MPVKKIFFIVIIITGLLSCGNLKKTSKTVQEAKPGSALIWHDEFIKEGLPDSTNWGYEVGYIRNKEQQYYTNAKKENCRIQKGKLVITSAKEKFDTANYTSASINTYGRQSFSGDIRVEVRAKLPWGKGIWPAIWMMGDNRGEVGWPKCAEIDIMEFVGHTPETIWGTLHWWDSAATNKSHHVSKGSKIILKDIHTAFHVYAMERKNNSISLFVDDSCYFKLPVPARAFPGSFTGPLYLLINTAVGGSWGGEIDDKVFPQKFYIDYVRVYRL